MTKRTLTGSAYALRGLAVGLFWTQLVSTQLVWTQLAAGQGVMPDAGEEGDCTSSPEPHECAERCPRFDTCYIEDDAQLYYRVDDERFECAGLDCLAASAELGDYCCQRGEYAPSRGGGGCALAAPAQLEPPEPARRWATLFTNLCASLGALGLLVISRRARARR